MFKLAKVLEAMIWALLTMVVTIRSAPQPQTGQTDHPTGGGFDVGNGAQPQTGAGDSARI